MTPKELKAWAEGNIERRKEGWHDEVVVELNKHADRIDARLHRFFKWILVIVAIIGFTSALALAGYGVLLRKQHQITNQIQDQRREFVLRSCNEQNLRHNETTKVLNKLLDEAIKNKKLARAQANDTKTQNILLLNALVPIQDCAAQVATALDEPKRGN